MGGGEGGEGETESCQLCVREVGGYFASVGACVGGVGRGEGEGGSWLALVSGVGGCVLAEVEVGVLSCMFLYFCGC